MVRISEKVGTVESNMLDFEFYIRLYDNEDGVPRCVILGGVTSILQNITIIFRGFITAIFVLKFDLGSVLESRSL